MRVLNNIEPQQEVSCAALGCFDGVHIGHQKIITDMCGYAKKNDLVSTVFTFTASPASVLGKAPQRAVMSQNQKENTLESLGVEKCFSIDFMTIRNTSAEDFVNNILIKQLNVKALFCGFNYRFGKNARGDAEMLRELCEKKGVKVFVTMPVCFGDIVVSSSKIRSLIEDGKMRTANRLLGKPFSVEDIVVEGKHNGRTVGVPTINQNLPAIFVSPRSGVYASFAYIDGKRFEAVTNVGTRPTVGGDFKNVETHILGNFRGELYGKKIKTELLYFIRDERKFSNLTELSEQIKRDVDYIYGRNIYSKY